MIAPLKTILSFGFNRVRVAVDLPGLGGNLSKFFDRDFYTRSYPDIAGYLVDPLTHYISIGWKEGRNPSADFDTLFYRLVHTGLSHPALCPLEHYASIGHALALPTNHAAALANPEQLAPRAETIAAFTELPGVLEYFNPEFYSARYPDVPPHPGDMLDHYFKQGWRENRNPSSRFDTAFYRTQFMRLDTTDICPLDHFLRYGQAAGLPATQQEARSRAIGITQGKIDPATYRLPEISPEFVRVLTAQYFDRAYYLHLYPDIVQAGIDPFWHYINWGCGEKRSPNPFFDPEHYISNYMQGSIAGTCALLHYATIGRLAGFDGSRQAHLWRMEKTAEVLFNDNFKTILSSLGFDASFFDSQPIRSWVLPIFSANTYRKAKGADAAESDVELLFRYLALDFPNGMPPGPMFNDAHYLEELRNLGLPLPQNGQHPLHHWLEFGMKQGVSPCPMYSNADYLRFNPDLNTYPGALFEHFIRHGMQEGRRFIGLTSIHPSHLEQSSGEVRPQSRVFCEKLSPEAIADQGYKDMQSFVSSGRLEQCVREAAALDPEVGKLASDVLSMVPPWHDYGYTEYSQFIRLLPDTPIDNVVLIPFCKLGGADYVAGVMSHTLSANGKTLVLRTDASDWVRPDWFPEDAISIDLSRHFAPFDLNYRMRVLYELLVRLRPQAVYNVNSRLAFDTFERYGERLSMVTKLYAYYFCADRTPDGIEAGYPIWYFSNVLPNLTAALIDNQALADQLIARFCLTGELRARVRCVYTPAMTTIPARPVAADQIASGTQRLRQRLLWAGRLDAQKRFDLVQAVARRMPEVDFDCWGAAVLDAPPDISALPPNLRLHAPFKSYDDLPLKDADGWLYTSAWDGLPTILIELGALGLPIVGSAVGGVAEIVDTTTGWPLPESATVDDYVLAITEMLGDQGERLKRAAALQARVKTQHSHEAYAKSLLADDLRIRETA